MVVAMSIPSGGGLRARPSLASLAEVRVRRSGPSAIADLIRPRQFLEVHPRLARAAPRLTQVPRIPTERVA